MHYITSQLEKYILINFLFLFLFFYFIAPFSKISGNILKSSGEKIAISAKKYLKFSLAVYEPID
jgi:hypothetical protein